MIQKNKLTNARLVGSLCTARPKKIVTTHEGELLLQGVHDSVKVKLLQD